MRDCVRRLAVRPDLLWLEVHARSDVMNFYRTDPVSGIGVDPGPGRRNPIVQTFHFRDVLIPGAYRRFRWNFFRMHFQFIMANDVRAEYDYFLYLCGPLPLDLWARRPAAALAAFGADASLDQSIFEPGAVAAHQ
jgi:hypothetical protein